MQLDARYQTGASRYLLAAKVNSEHPAVAVVCIAQLAQKLMLLVVAQPRVCHLGAHLHMHPCSEGVNTSAQASCSTFIVKPLATHNEAHVSQPLLVAKSPKAQAGCLHMAEGSQK